MVDTSRARSGYVHEAFFYRSDDEYLAANVPFVRDGLAAGEPVLVAVPRPRLDLLRSALGAHADGVRFIDMARLGNNPAKIIPVWQQFVAEGGGAAVRGIGEPVWPGRSEDELAECQLHEALLNLAVAPDTPLWLRCPYDASGLGADTIEEAHRSHPLLADHDGLRGSALYGGALHAHAAFGAELPEPSVQPDELAFAQLDLRSVRRMIRRHAVAAGMRPPRAADLVLAIHEIATNSVEHGGGGGVLRVWRDADVLVCEVRDAGRVHDPLVGRRTLSSSAEGGRGVWLANHLCDLVSLRSSSSGTTVRVLMRL